MPIPFQNVLNDGSHGGGSLAFQNFKIAKTDVPPFSDRRLGIGSEVYHHLMSLANTKYGQSTYIVENDGSVAPDIDTPDEVLDLIMTSIEKNWRHG